MSRDEAGLAVMMQLAQQDQTTIAVGAPAALALLVTVRDTYDLVILDSPPPRSVVDPAALARRTSAILLVAQAGSTKVEALRAAHDVLRWVDRRPLGVVLNRVRGFERRAHVGAPLELASRPGGG